ncbi:cytoplasmic protein [Glaciecola sp. KUL10]|jgi:uncharacterized protein YqiB (DUF1249 family)|nr:cytoplasmic protein [Glaciecola sp. KUL10]
MKLLPDCDTEDLSYRFVINEELEYKISILDSSRYTSTLEMSQVQKNTPKFLCPVMEIRLYHDAKMAEVLASQRMAKLKPSYDYPNLKMHQRNEKQMVNVFLAEWLHFCLQQQVKQTSSI